MKTFEDYLKDICFEENPQVLDDEMSDYFAGWLGEQDVNSMMIHADGWMRQTKAFIGQAVRMLTN